MSNENLRIWDQVQTTPNEHTKKFDKGGFKGHSANPLYLAKRATELFGPVGIGWGINSLDHFKEEFSDGTIVITEHIELWYLLDGEKGTLDGWASEKAAYITNQGKGYLKVDEEARKKCRTNAMSKCFSLLGFSADLWFGYYDSEAYIEEREKEQHKADFAKTLEADYKQAVDILDTFCLCKTDEERELVSKWSMMDLKLTLGAMQVTPGLSLSVVASLSEAKNNGVQSHEMLERAKAWLKKETNK